MTLTPVKPPTGKHVNTLLFGPAKTGKTAAAASAPGPVMLLNADMPNATRYAHERYGSKITEYRFEGLQTMIDVTHTVETAPDKWGTIVLDTVGNMRGIIVRDVTNDALRASLPVQGDAAEHLERFCRKLCELPVNVVFVAHLDRAKDESGAEWPQMGTTNLKYAMNLMGMVDVIGRTSADVNPDTNDIRFVASLSSRFPALGLARELDLTEWSRLIQTAPQGAERKAKAA